MLSDHPGSLGRGSSLPRFAVNLERFIMTFKSHAWALLLAATNERIALLQQHRTQNVVGIPIVPPRQRDSTAANTIRSQDGLEQNSFRQLQLARAGQQSLARCRVAKAGGFCLGRRCDIWRLSFVCIR